MSFWYLATPYSKYEQGIEAAFQHACENTALLIKAGIPVFSPIVHTHPVARHGGINPLDHGIWMAADAPFMSVAIGCIVCMLPGWEESYGVRCEIATFQAAGRPILYMEPGNLPTDLCTKPVQAVPPDVLTETTCPLEMLA